MTANALAKRLGLSRQYISRAEQGTYASLNPALLRWTANALSIETHAVNRRYLEFQKATRKATVEEINPHRLERHEGNLEPSHILFERWRSGYWPSVTAFSNAFCVHSDTVSNYEEGIRKDMPSAVRNALKEVHLIDAHFETFSPQTRSPQRPSETLPART